jgi:hypothetical protein
VMAHEAAHANASEKARATTRGSLCSRYGSAIRSEAGATAG